MDVRLMPPLLLLVTLLTPCILAKPPNILFIVADDLGHNDASINGSPQIPTPHLDAIFQGGTTLSMYHAQPVCSPSRASMLSGRHVIHTGIYMPFDGGVTNEALDPSYTLLPRYLKRAANYSTSLIGKWHLGANERNATPVGRGFDTAYGYWSGAEDYETHSVTAGRHQVYDMQNDLLADVGVNGTFSTAVFAARAVALISAQGAAGPDAPPLFLYLAFQNVHWPLEAPPEFIARFANTTGGNQGRQLVCAMAAYLDEAVGNVTAALAGAGLEGSTVVVLVSDNGGPTHSNEGTWSNNFPLRGGKNTLWEGGTRVLAAVKGPGITPGRVVDAPVHATDWLPSLVSMATGGQDWRSFAPPGEPPYQDGDGMDVWATIAGASPSPPSPLQRDWLLLEAHNNGGGEGASTHGNALIEWRGEEGVLKYLLLGPEDPQVEDGWWPPDGQDAAATPYTTHCTWQGGGARTGNASIPNLCTHNKPCLFNLSADPCEYHDIADQHPHVVTSMGARLAGYTTVPPLVGKGCLPQVIAIVGTHGPAFQYLPCDVPPPLPAPPLAPPPPPPPPPPPAAPAATATTAAAGTTTSTTTTSSPRPNIIWLQADSVDGRLFDPTDAHMYSRLLIDALRSNYLSQGITFARHYTNSPQCVPSRTSMVTSRYIHDSWTPNNGQGLARSTRTGALDKGCVATWSTAFCQATAARQNVTATFIDTLQGGGYRFAPFGRFDIGGGVLDDYGGGVDGDGFHEGPELSILARGAGIEGAIDSKGPKDTTNTRDPNAYPADQGRAGEARDWLLGDDPGAHPGAPFFLWLGLMAPHPPYDTNSTWGAHVNATPPLDIPPQVPRNATHPYDQFMSRAKHVWGEFPGYSDADVGGMRRAYWGALAEASELLRQVLHAAEVSGHLNNTWVFLTSDHGELALEHRQDLKSSLYEPSVRVPLVAIPFGVPGVAAAPSGGTGGGSVVVTNISSHMDIWPTLAELTGTPLPGDARGESLVPFLRMGARDDTPHSPPPHSHSHSHPSSPSFSPPRKGLAVATYASNYAPTGSYMLRQGPYKLITFGHAFPWSNASTYPPQLFNVEADPMELHDLAPSSQALVASLMTVLEAELGGPGSVDRIEAALMADNLRVFGDVWFARCTGEELVAAFLSNFLGSQRDAVIQRVTEWFGQSPLSATGKGGTCPK